MGHYYNPVVQNNSYVFKKQSSMRNMTLGNTSLAATTFSVLASFTLKNMSHVTSLVFYYYLEANRILFKGRLGYYTLLTKGKYLSRCYIYNL